MPGVNSSFFSVLGKRNQDAGVTKDFFIFYFFLGGVCVCVCVCDLVFKGFLEYIKKENQPHYRHDVIINTETDQSVSEFLENELLVKQTDSVRFIYYI